MNKVLIIRFSSFGDIVQCSSVVELIRQRYPQAQIDWVTRSEFDYLVKLNHDVHHVWSFDKKLGLSGLFKLGNTLKAQNYDHVYDAHNNLRSKLLSFIMRARIFNRPDWLTRPKDRLKRIMLFTFRINTFPKPFKGIHSFEIPLKKWGIESKRKNKFVSWDFPVISKEKVAPFLQKKNEIILVPSAAWEMKRWPLDLWKKLIVIMPDQKFIVLGGKEDHFCEELKAIAPGRVENLAGKLSLVESCTIIEAAALVISADTGLLHVADALGVKALALIGPTAFGFTTGNQIKTMEVELHCRPCTKDGRGSCSQDVYQKCMVDITPAMVAESALQLIRG
ncbi:MAG: glycosyltransferase family 9 protein [Bacteriovorax sp.]|nr:glycosyltransferase family 9 protein [Bacteriovorax sp.]